MFKIQKGYDSLPKTFSLPKELAEKLDRLAHENKLSVNQLVIQCLNYAMSDIDIGDTEK